MSAEASERMPESKADQKASDFEARLGALAEELREELGTLNDPQGKALFETTAEVLGGLETAFRHFQAKNEEAWRPSSPVLGN